MAEEYYSLPYRYNTPLPQIIPYTPSNDVSSQQGDPQLEAYLNDIQSGKINSQGQAPMGIQTRSLNPFNNAYQDFKEMGTGLNAIGADPYNMLLKPIGKEINKISNEANKSLNDYLTGKSKHYNVIDQMKDSYKATKTLGKDAFNFLASNYDVTTDDLKDILSGKQTVGQVAGRAVINAYAHPVMTALDIASLGVGGKVGKIGKYTAKEVETAKKALRTGETLKTGSKAKSAAKDISKAIDDYTGEAGDEATRITQRSQAIKQKVISEGFVTPEEADRLLNEYKTVDYETSFRGDAKAPVSDFNIEDLAVSASQGDKVASSILDGIARFDEGYLKAIPDNIDDIIKGSLTNEGKSAAQKVTDAINIQTKEIKSKIYPVMDLGKELSKNSIGEISGAIKTLETGKVLPEGSALKNPTKVLSEMVDAWDNAVPEYAKIDKEELALAQKLVRDGFATTVAEGQKILKPYIEEGVNIRDLANKGDKIARSIAEGKDAYARGYLKLVPHGLAEVMKDFRSDTFVGNLDERFYAGKYSQRVWGNATYEDIAKQLTNPNEWLDAQAKQFIDQGLVNEINKGTLGGQPLVNELTKKVKYIEPVTGEGKQVTLRQVLESASDKPLTQNSIAIDNDVLKELKSQVQSLNDAPYTNQILSDTYRVGKSVQLGTWHYLTGNLQTGLYNALMNNQLNPVSLVKNIGEAIQSKGRLAKEAGVYRQTATPLANKIKNPILHGFAWANSGFTNAAQAIDARVQNLMAEMALHKNLEKEGIRASERIEALKNMDKMKLAEVIDDTQKVALINPPKSFIPREALKGLLIINPFITWLDTALQSNIHMFKKEPLLTNLVINHVASTIGFDQEMQNRLNLGVRSDKGFVHYRYNPQTKRIEGVTTEFTPAITSMKMIGDIGNAIEKGDYRSFMNLGGAPFFGAVSAALQGKNRYGKPLARKEIDRTIKGDLKFIQGDKRYEFKPEEGFVEKKGGYADEVFHTALNELLVLPRFYNSTVAPIIAGATNTVYYRPYANQFIGEYAPIGQAPQNANPRSAITGQNALDFFTGRYSSFYNPLEDNPRSNANLPQQLLKGRARRMGLNEMLINQYGGGN